jgi:hypothetical protein
MLIKKIDVEKHFAAKRAMRRTGALNVRRVDAPVILETKTTGPKSNAQDFAEAFSTEHYSSASVIRQTQDCEERLEGFSKRQ